MENTMAKNIFKNLPTDQHERLKNLVANKVGKLLGAYTQTPQYTFDLIAGKRNEVAYKLALREVNEISKQVAKSTTQGDPKQVKNQFKAFVRSDTRILAKRYDWRAIKLVQKTVEEA